MRKASRRQILSDEIYVSGRPGTSGRLRCVLLFPNEYALGMPNLGFQTLYRLLSSHPEIICERAFFPPVPDRSGRPGIRPLRSLEMGTPLGGFDLLCISSSFELDWLRIPTALETGGVPPLAADRKGRSPLVVIGGPAPTANPEPLAQFADAIFIGEVEEVFQELAATLLAGNVATPPGRAALLEGLGSLPGFYIPSHPPSQPVRRGIVQELGSCETRTEIISPHAEFPSRFLMEVGRGCPRGCRFCLARQIYQPFRIRSLEALLATARVGREFTDKFGLVGAAVADHPDLPSLASAIVEMGGKVSTSSLRAERVTAELLEPLAASGQRSITLAPETADERLARRIGKHISRETVRAAINAASEAGIGGIKLYFMVGLPGETEADALSIADYVAELQGEFPGARFTVSVDQFIPKAHTELARVAVPDPRIMRVRLRAVGQALRAKTRARARIGSARWAAVQVALSRGGAELAPVLMTAAGSGGAGNFFAALMAEGLALDDYLGPQKDAAPGQMVDICPAVAGDTRDD